MPFSGVSHAISALRRVSPGWGTDYLAVVRGSLCSSCLVVRNGDEEMLKEEASLPVEKVK